MLFYGIAAGAEALAGIGGWNEGLYRTWYLTGAVWTAGWLGLGTAFLLGRTRFGYSFALCLLLAGVFTLLTQRRYDYPGAGSAPILYLIAAIVLAIAVAVETYFQNERWPVLAAGAVVGATVLSARVDADGHDRSARVCARPADRDAGRRPVPGHAAPADAVPEHHGRPRPGPRGDLQHLCVHAQEAGAALLARP